MISLIYTAPNASFQILYMAKNVPYQYTDGCALEYYYTFRQTLLGFYRCWLGASTVLMHICGILLLIYWLRLILPRAIMAFMIYIFYRALEIFQFQKRFRVMLY